MASEKLLAAEAEWREQFTAMQAALSSLKLDSSSKNTADAAFDDEDFEGYSSGTTGQDVWDFISDEDVDVFSSDSAEEPVHDLGMSPYGAAWLQQKSFDIASKNGMAPDVFEAQITSVLGSGRSEDELQTQLTDLVGYDDLDFIIDLLSHKDEILSAASQPQEQVPTGRLLSKAEREEQLRQRDYQHKTATLAPSVKREAEYPHVYRAYNAGNTLSASGKKYGLPVGSERKQFEKYEEYFVPAGKKGVPGPGERLVKISELDGLCRNTFKGYKTLNRMQSLVYPVANKTNENMLICAPTGAVSFKSTASWDIANCDRVKLMQPCSQSFIQLDSTSSQTQWKTCLLQNFR